MDKYHESLTPEGQFIYERLTMPDEERNPTDMVRRSSYIPCCQIHEPNRICILEKGHND